VRIGVTGHQRLADEAAWAWVDETLHTLLSTVEPPLVGVTALAPGAEQRFARAVLRCGGRLHAVIPFVGYERSFATADEVAGYRAALLGAARVEQPADGGGDDAGWQARRRVVDLSDELIAVWDGAPASGRGDVAEIVEYALQTHVPLVQVNPLARTTERLR
jgi:hypothetical protein